MRSMAIVGSLALCLISCSNDGCMDPEARNFDPSATSDDGSCIYPEGCTDSTALNFDPEAVKEDGSCLYLPTVAFFVDVSDDPECGDLDLYLNEEFVGRFEDLNDDPDPDCNSDDVILWSPLALGHYDIEVVSSGGCKWYRGIEVESGRCQTHRIELD